MLTIVGIFLFLVFRFRSIAYGVGAAISLVHDLALVLSVYAIVDGFVPFATEGSSPRKISTGKVSDEPPPAFTLIKAATAPTVKA